LFEVLCKIESEFFLGQILGRRILAVVAFTRSHEAGDKRVKESVSADHFFLIARSRDMNRFAAALPFTNRRSRREFLEVLTEFFARERPARLAFAGPLRRRGPFDAARRVADFFFRPPLARRFVPFESDARLAGVI